MERTYCYYSSSQHLGTPLGTQKVILHCDNQAVVDIWKAGTTKSAGTMALVCMLYSCEAKHYIRVITTHIKGVNSATVDAISCFQVTLF